MGYEQEAFRKLMSNIWGKKSRMQEEMSKGAKGEPFIVQELSRKGPQTPTQLAAAMRATTGRVSTLLSALEKKGQITREIDPNDRRIVHVSLTEAGERRAEKQREDMREAVCWIFSQMGERDNPWRYRGAVVAIPWRVAFCFGARNVASGQAIASSQPCGRGRQCVPIVRGCAATNSGKPCNRKSLSGNTQKRA